MCVHRQEKVPVETARAKLCTRPQGCARAQERQRRTFHAQVLHPGAVGLRGTACMCCLPHSVALTRSRSQSSTRSAPAILAVSANRRCEVTNGSPDA
eukprot:6205934-Pleurochrysis_carterae.AAC.2